jgi:predicted secreted Zn-dependent protease
VRWSSLFSVASLLSLLSGAQELAPVLLNDPLVDVTRCTSAIDYQYYEVTGASRREVREQLLSKGPVDEHGYQRFAFAAWTLEWDWPLQADGTRRYSDTKVTCKAHVVLPRFRALGTRPKTSSSLRDDDLFGLEVPFGSLKTAYFIGVSNGCLRSECSGS